MNALNYMEEAYKKVRKNFEQIDTDADFSHSIFRARNKFEP